jgi:hypothetical protein
MQGGGCINGREVHEGKWVFEGALSAGCAVHLNFSHDGYMESTMLLFVQARWRGKKYPFRCYGIFSAINSVFKALHLYLNKNVAEIQLPGNNTQQISNSK